MADNAKTPKGERNISDVRVTDDGVNLIIVADLTGEAKVSSTGKTSVLAMASNKTVRHPDLGELQVSVFVTTLTDEYREARDAARSARNALRSFKAGNGRGAQ